MKLITTKLIRSLNPCKNRLDNYLINNKNFKGSLKEFLALKTITHSDKLWVIFRLMSKRKAVKCATLIAKSVLSIYESKYPKNNKPRLAIKAALNWVKFPTKKNADAANAAAADAADAADDAYAADAASYAAYAAANAAYAAAANAADAADAAPYAAVRNSQEKLQIKIILKVMKEKL